MQLQFVRIKTELVYIGRQKKTTSVNNKKSELMLMGRATASV